MIPLANVEKGRYLGTVTMRGVWIILLTGLLASVESAKYKLRHGAEDQLGYYREAHRNVSIWRSELFRKTQQALATGQNLTGHARYSLFEPFVHCPPNTALTRLGDGDGGKWACMPFAEGNDCVVYSLGSNNNYEFEEAILNTTGCNVYTFDCTVKGRSIHPRHHFYKWCVGGEGSKVGPYASSIKTLGEIVKELKHSHIDLFKMDIEGCEFDVFASWNEDFYLPRFVLFELHYRGLYYKLKVKDDDGAAGFLMWKTKKELSLQTLSFFFAHLAGLGYGIVSKEDNYLSISCTEIVLIRTTAAHL